MPPQAGPWDTQEETSRLDAMMALGDGETGGCMQLWPK